MSDFVSCLKLCRTVRSSTVITLGNSLSKLSNLIYFRNFNRLIQIFLSHIHLIKRPIDLIFSILCGRSQFFDLWYLCNKLVFEAVVSLN